MFGDSPMDYMTRDELTRHTDAVQRVAAQRRQDHVNALETRYAGVLVMARDPAVGRYCKGVVLLRCDDHYVANLTKVYECLEKNKTDKDAADAVRALGFPVLRFTGLDPENPCTLIPALEQLGRRFVGVDETGRWRSDRPNFANISKQRDEEYQKILDRGPVKVDYLPDQVFLCQDCAREYKYGESTSTAPLCFCTGLCQVHYKERTGREFPPVGAEIPLGKPEVCNLASALPEATRRTAEQFARQGAANNVVAETADQVKKSLDSLGAAPCNGRIIRKGLITYGDTPCDGFTVDDSDQAFVDHFSAVLYCLGHPGKGFPDLSLLKYGQTAKAAQKYIEQLSGDTFAWDSISGEAADPSSPLTVELSEEARAALTSLHGAELHGAVRLSSGQTIPAPRAGFYWLVEDDNRLTEKPLRAPGSPVETNAKAR
jgi:hypothetical protein